MMAGMIQVCWFFFPHHITDEIQDLGYIIGEYIFLDFIAQDTGEDENMSPVDFKIIMACPNNVKFETRVTNCMLKQIF